MWLAPLFGMTRHWLGLVVGWALLAVGCGSTSADANGASDAGADASTKADATTGSDASSQTAPSLAGFYWGGIAGDSCPPGSKPGSDDCPGADCGGSCVATDRCDSGCGAGFSCDAASGYCLPTQTCQSSAECAAGEYCAWREWSLSQGLCAPTPADLGEQCYETQICVFPARCSGGTCVLPCWSSLDVPAACPADWACVENACAPPL